MMKVGILGGRFNPVHNGHLRLAIEALEQAGLDRVELVPAFIPPHKGKDAVPGFSFRCRLIQAAIAQMRKLALNPMEGERAGPSYTVDTLELYHQLYPDREPYFLIGCPDFVQLPKWHQGQRLPELTHFIVVVRETGDEQLLARFTAEMWPEAEHVEPNRWLLPSGYRIQLIQVPQLEVSSSLIRDKLARGKCIRYLVPDPVWEELTSS
jgi:nicotinate-nucleotide adenylyltransferase